MPEPANPTKNLTNHDHRFGLPDGILGKAGTAENPPNTDEAGAEEAAALVFSAAANPLAFGGSPTKFLTLILINSKYFPGSRKIVDGRPRPLSDWVQRLPAVRP